MRPALSTPPPPRPPQICSALDAALPQPRLDRAAAALGALLGGDWGAGVAERLDAALPG